MFQEQDGERTKNGPQPTAVAYHLESGGFKGVREVGVETVRQD
jgi:hypothetical protein